MTVAEVSVLLHCTDQHVCDLIDEGQLQALNIGGNAKRFWRIPREAYDAFLASRHSFNL